MPSRSDAARVAFDQHDWAEAYRVLCGAVDASTPEPVDLERLAVAAYLVGEDDTSARAWELAHQEHLRRDGGAEAARCAFWLALGLLLRGEMAHAGGWLARAERIIGDGGLDCVARGYLLLPPFLQALGAGDLVACRQLAGEAYDLGRRFGDPDLTALGTLCQGQALLAEGEAARGIRLLDETMVAVTAGEVSPIPTGIIYCAVIEACMQAHDLRRAAEWTEALTGWCDQQPALVPYRGQCLVHRSQILQRRGDWRAALAEAERAQALLAQPPHAALGVAFYQLAELHRLRGDFDAAEPAYRAASRHGYEPEPGLALLHLAEGDLDGAVVMIRRAVDERHDPLERPELLAAHVEIMRTVGDVGAARASADELVALAARGEASLLDALAGHASGSVLLAEGEPTAAVGHLRRASTLFHELDMPYDAARTRTLIGLACAALGDRTSADLELEAAQAALAALGARPDVTRVAALRGEPVRPPTGPLTGREREVLREVAAGRTNREIAEGLVISEHTVARHLQNIFTKLDVRSRAAATAYAYEHELV